MFFDGKSRNFENSAYAIECCEGDLCNNGTFPVLPAPVELGRCLILKFTKQLFIRLYLDKDDNEQSDMMIKLTFALICPIAIMIVLASAFLLVMKQYHQRRMARMNVITGYQDSDLVYKDDLHATAAGDSTLRVS